MEYHTGDQEQAEEQDLDNKTDDDNPTAGVVGGCFLLSEDGATQGLSEKTEDVACDEEFGEPGAADDGAWRRNSPEFSDRGRALTERL